MKKKILLYILIFIFFIFPFKSVYAEEYFWRIGSSEYSKFSTALTHVNDNEQTTIVLINDRSENITIPSGKNIIIDLNGHTLRNNGTNNKSTVITNNGTLSLTNGTVTSSAETGIINNNSGAVLNILDGNYIATYTRQALYNNGGTANIYDGNLEADTSVRATVHNLNNGVINIKGGNIVSNNSYAVYNEKGTLNIGTLDEQYDSTAPIIQGKTYGVIANYKFNMYDGTIKGATYHVGISTTGSTPTITNDVNETKVDAIEEYSEKDVRIDGEEIGGVLYDVFTYNLDTSSIVKITFDPNGGTVSTTSKKLLVGEEIGELPNPVRENHSFDGWYTSSTGGDKITETTKPSVSVTYYAHWTYVDPNTVAFVEGHGLMSLEDAFATGGKIRLEKDVVVTSSMLMNKDATLDLNGHTISLENSKININKNVTITDSSTSKTGLITSNDDFTVVVLSNGHLIHKGGTIEGLGSYGAIRNAGTLEIDGGMSTSTSNRYTIYNEKTLVLKSGTVHSTKATGIQVGPNSTFEMKGGLVKSDSEKDQAINLDANSITTINAGTIEALGTHGAGIGAFGGSTLTVNGGTIKGTDMAITGNGNEINGNVNITINDGTIIATGGVGMYLPQRNSITTINGGNISGPTAIEIRASKLVVNDGNIVGTSDTYSITKNDSGTTSKGAAIAVSQHNTRLPIEVIINGGNLKAKVPVAEGNPQNNPQDAIDQVSITIKNGNFDSTGDKVIDAENPETITQLVTGGIYTYDPSEYVQDGYGVVTLPNKKYEVTKIHNVTIDQDYTDIVSVDKDKYPYKSTVELNIKAKAGYDPVIEIEEANGRTKKVRGTKFIMPDDDVTIKVSYEKIIINPTTGDNIIIYVFLLLMSIVGLFIIRAYKTKSKDIK